MFSFFACGMCFCVYIYTHLFLEEKQGVFFFNLIELETLKAYWQEKVKLKLLAYFRSFIYFVIPRLLHINYDFLFVLNMSVNIENGIEN